MFHLAFPVHDISAARTFYVDQLGFAAGRESAQALILNIGDNQIVAQLSAADVLVQPGIYPRHFGLIFDHLSQWMALRDRVVEVGIGFYREPMVRFPGEKIEHSTFFIEDPSRNLLEFKYYSNRSAIFGEIEIRSIGDDTR